MLDLIIKNGRVVTHSGVRKLDIGVQNEKISVLASELSDVSHKTIDASGKLVLPGMFDCHTHMGIPILNTHSIDDFESGSVAAAFGGITSIIDFTVQEKGQTLRESIEARLKKAHGKSHVDYGLHVNVTDDPENRLSEIPRLAHEGFRFFKVFSTYRQAGMMLSWDQFRLILQKVDDHGGLLFLHAEDNDLVETMTDEHLENGQTSARYHPLSRTCEAEAYAIKIAAEIAGELDASIYIVHLSSKAGLEAGLEARKNGVNIYLETCPQYLLLTDEKYQQKNGHFWITTPPLRKQEDCAALWRAVADGDIDVVATDHCPFTMQQKNDGGGQFHLTPNGIPGVETLFPLLYTYGVEKGRIRLSRLLELLAEKPAQLFGLEGEKGTIQIGADADFVIWNPNRKSHLQAKNLHGNADWSPYEGMEIAGELDYTILRGHILVNHGKFTGNQIRGKSLCRP